MRGALSRLVSYYYESTRPVEPLLGRWCHVHSHKRCNPFQKVDQSHADSCVFSLWEKAKEDTVAHNVEEPPTRDPISVFVVDEFGM